MSQSLYERLGGARTVDRAVEILYQKVQADARIRPYFDRVSTRRLIRKQKAFLRYAFGGPSEYSGVDLAEAHRGAVADGLDDSHYDIMCEHLASTLRELGAPADAVAEAIQAIEDVREDVLCRSAVAGEAPAASPPEPSLIKRTLGLLYGVVCYAIFFGTFLYAAGWVGNLLVPKSLDGEAVDPFWPALLINVGLLSVFAVQHSVMARPAFKRRWTKIVPRPLERSTYVLFSSVALILLFWQWRPLGGVIWDVEDPAGRAALYGLFGFGWLLVLVSTFLINHFDLFGLRQVWLYFRGKKYTPLRFQLPLLYRVVRHPLYLGWLFAFWATPTMTVTHLVFAVVTTGYILVAIQFEERDLIDAHGLDYADYRKRVPMILPIPRRRSEPVAQPAT